MHGNVWEWCFDEFKRDLGSKTGTDPVQASFKNDKQQGQQLLTASLLTNGNDGDVDRVLRGGSWISDGGNCRSAFRSGLRASGGHDYFGFRFAVGLELTVAEPNGKL